MPGRAVQLREAPSEEVANQELPTSTFAAQIIEHFTQNATNRGPADRAEIRELLEELRQTKEAGTGYTLNDAELEKNYHLICIVATAGFTPRQPKDVSEDKDELISQALDSIDIIDLTIAQGSDVLFLFAMSKVPHIPNGPTFLWLIPGLLNLFLTWNDARVQAKTQAVLRRITTCKPRHGGLRRKGPVISLFLKGCVDDIMLEIDASQSSQRRTSKHRMHIPSANTVSKASSIQGSLQQLHTTSRIDISTSLQAVLVLQQCLEPLLPDLTEINKPWLLKRSDHNLTWMLQSLKLSYRVLLNYPKPSNDRGEYEMSQRSAMDLLCRLLANSCKAEAAPTLKVQIAASLSEIISELLQSTTFPSHEIQLTMSRSILIFYKLSYEDVGVSSILMNFTHILDEAQKNSHQTSILLPDLECSLVLVRDLKPTLESSPDSKLSRISFESSELSTIFGRLLKRNLGLPDNFHDMKGVVYQETNGNVDGPQAWASDIDRMLSRDISTNEILTFTELQSRILTTFTTMCDSARYGLLSLLGKLACARAAPYQHRHSCVNCDEAVLSVSQDTKRVDCNDIFNLMNDLIRLPQLQKAVSLRLVAIRSLQRLLTHTNRPDHFDMKTSGLGKWALRSLTRPLRELRIVAGQTIAIFASSPLGHEYIKDNRIIIMETLRNLMAKDEIMFCESSILTWGQLARVAGDQEKALIVVILLGFVGHHNTFISSLAYDELLKLCNHSATEAVRVLSPLWPSIAFPVVKDLKSRPQVTQRFCDLLGVEVARFLTLTEVYTLPFLLHARKLDIIYSIVEAHQLLDRRSNQGTFSVGDLLFGSNLVTTVAHLLLQPSSNTETMIMSIFTDVLRGQPCPSFAELLSWNPTALTVELLKLAADGDENAKARCRQAIVFLATEVARRAAGTPAKKHDVLPVFFERNVLGIMTSFSQVFTAFASRQSLEEKARSLGAIREMIKIGKSSLCNGLPQIRAILQSAMEEPILCDEAFRAWGSLLNSLGQEDLETLINPTFAIIAQYWGFLTSTVQEETHTTTTRLFTSHPEMIQAQVLSIPSLASVPLMHKIEDELVRIRSQMGPKESFHVFDQRCKDENAIVVTRALIELDNYLKRHEDYLHINAISEKPDMVLSQLTRSILDACVKFSDTSTEIAVLCAQCLGRIGCLDPTRLDANREVNKILVLSNFSREDETVDFVLFFLQEVLVKAFLSARDSRAQNFLGYAIQELLKFSRLDSSMTLRSRDLQVNAHYRRWVTLPDSVREVLAPFLNSKLTLHKSASLPEDSFPIYRRGVSYTNWLRGFVSSLLRKGRGSNAEGLFKICQKVIPRQDIAIASFLLPYAALNVVAGGQDAMRWGNEIHEQVRDVVTSEILLILSHPLPEKSQSARDALIECSQSVFHVLDYFSQWVQEKRKELANMEQIGSRSKGMGTQQESEFDIVSYQKQNVELVLSKIPAEVISQRAIDCKSFSRALYHWEQHIRDQRGLHPGDEKILEPLYKRLQDIYTQIDEPDGIEGISAHLQVLSVDQQVLQHRNAGRWTTVQNYYELLNSERPNNPDIQISLLKALKESGQYDVLLNQVGAFQLSGSISAHVIPFAVEASWATGKWENLKNYLSMSNAEISGDFNIRIGKAFAAFRGGDITEFSRSVEILRLDVARSLTFGNTSALHACHDPMLKLHVITEIEAIIGVDKEKDFSRSDLLTNLDKRLDVLGAFSSDKQYLLGIRRAAIQCSRYGFLPIDESSTWLTGARLARKSESINQAFNSVLRASKLGDHSATIEHSRLLWKVGQHRKAIQSLEGAIAANAFRTYDYVTNGSTTTTITNDQSHQQHQNLLTARAHLLLAKWNDKAGQTQSEMIIQRYKRAVDYYCRWEKGHYHLGKHYNKLLESEQSKHPAKQAQTYINGEMSKLVIENYLRSLAFGAKYIYQTIPKILTLWLELGNQVDKPPDAIYGNDDNFRKHTMMQNRRLFEAVSAQMKKYIDRLPAFVFYTAFSQIVARICHSNQTVYGSLVDIIVKVVTTHPQQALWTLLATVKSSAKDRSSRGASCIVRIQDNTKKAKHEATANDMRTLIMQGQKLSDQLLRVTDMEVAPKVSTVSISRDLNFRHNGAPCRLVIPLESTLTAALPPVSDNVNIKTHKAFPKDALTISAFLDEVLVLSSLQRPRRISIRGSDGRVYNILCKPKDDLRKDQRLMEFNTMINRALKKDVESSKRRLYIKTYAVTPLNEECGLIEWVDNLKTLRDILLKIYKQKNTSINYQILRDLLDQSIADYPHNTHIFREKVLSQFQPVFHEWFVEMFPEPSMWFAARLRYTRSCAVMSLVGHVLGLGDRHGENILFEEGSGGTFHVDFNCLFDKGLNFEKPEVVPFRLTQNMVDAFGAYGYEGPFRKSCELSLAIMRQYEDTLMTILETFLWDPTTDFLGGKKKKSRAALVEGGPGAPDTPEGVLENVRGKVRGYLGNESVPLSVEGYVQSLIEMAVDDKRLCKMYIGWCSFF